MPRKKKAHGKERPSFYGKGISSLFRSGDLVFGRGEELDSIGRYLEMLGHKRVCARDINIPLIDDLIAGRLTDGYIAKLEPVMQRHAKLLRRNKAYLLSEGGKNPWPNSGKTKRSVAIRRACKMIIREAARNHHRSVHFMMKGVSHWRVTRKQHYGKREVDVSISGGEFRTAFKCKEEAGFPPIGSDRPAFFFYESNQSIPAPWEQGSRFQKHYAKYQERRARKGKPELTDRAGEAIDLDFGEAVVEAASPKPGKS